MTDTVANDAGTLAAGLEELQAEGSDESDLLKVQPAVLQDQLAEAIVQKVSTSEDSGPTILAPMAEQAKIQPTESEIIRTEAQEAEIRPTGAQEAEIRPTEAQEAEIRAIDAEICPTEAQEAEIQASDAEIHPTEAQEAEIRAIDAEICPTEAQEADIQASDAEIHSTEPEEPDIQATEALAAPANGITEPEKKITESEVEAGAQCEDQVVMSDAALDSNNHAETEVDLSDTAQAEIQEANVLEVAAESGMHTESAAGFDANETEEVLADSEMSETFGEASEAALTELANETDDAIMAEAEAALNEVEAEAAAGDMGTEVGAEPMDADTESAAAAKLETGDSDCVEQPASAGAGTARAPLRTPSIAAAVAAAAKAAAAAAAGGGQASTLRPSKPRKPIGTGRRSRQARRDPLEPVNPRSAYTIFVKEKMEELGVHIKDTDLKLKGKEQIKVVAQQWRDLSAEEKERYQQMFTTAFAHYEQELAAYKQTESHRLFQEKLKAMDAEKAKNNPSTSSAPNPANAASAAAAAAAKKKASSGLAGVTAKIAAVGGGVNKVTSSVAVTVAPVVTASTGAGMVRVKEELPLQQQAAQTVVPQQLLQGMVQLPQGLSTVSAAPVSVSGAAGQPLLTATPIPLNSLNQFVSVSQLQHLLPPGTVTLLAVTQQQPQQLQQPQLQQQLASQLPPPPQMQPQPQQQVIVSSQALLPSFPELSQPALLAYGGAQPAQLQQLQPQQQQQASVSYAFSGANVPLLDSFVQSSSAGSGLLEIDSKLGLVVSQQALQQPDMKPLVSVANLQIVNAVAAANKPMQYMTEIVGMIQRIAQAMDRKASGQPTQGLEEAVMQLRNKMFEAQNFYQTTGRDFVSELQAQIDKILPSLNDVRNEVLYKLQDVIRSMIFSPQQQI